MRLTELVTKTIRQPPAGEVSPNAKLLLRGGFVYRNLAGVWSLLPLGLRCLRKVETIIREEMNAIGGQEVLLNVLQSRSTWEQSGRWRSLKGVMYQFKDPGGSDVGLGFTHEEVIAEILRNHLHSAADLPKAVYQIQTKFRFEPRPRSGLLRGREFGMKDLYSFHADTKDLDRFYQTVLNAYRKIFQRMSLTTLVTEASGGVFSKEYSHEFQVLAETGEDTIYYCSNCRFARNKEIVDDPKMICPSCHKTKLTQARAIEVGNTFKLGTKFAEAAHLYIEDKHGRTPVVMASYGIGTSRLIGAIAEVNADRRGMVWPPSVAPYVAYLVSLSDAQPVSKAAEDVYTKLGKQGIEVLYDDRRSVSPGEKFADADLIGCPYRLLISEKTGSRVEVKHRATGNIELKTLAKAIDIIQQV